MRTKRPDPAAAQQRSGLQENRSPIRAVCQHCGFFLQTAERKRILPTLSAVWAFCCATPHRKPKRFCSTQCHHVVSGNGKQQQLCPICKEPFFAYSSSHRKYCSRLAMGSTERKWLMEKEHYHKIITYQTTVSILKSWMRAGLSRRRNSKKSTP